MYLYARGVEFTSFYDFDSWLFWIVPTVWYALFFLDFGLFRQCGILDCSDSVVFLYFIILGYETFVLS
jgi:hypothetical protein